MLHASCFKSNSDCDVVIHHTTYEFFEKCMKTLRTKLMRTKTAGKARCAVWSLIVQNMFRTTKTVSIR